ncbi:DnaD domain protein ['Camptotheca acuminata' phytoplasma]|uniref:DnaD domain protein n=1 Tax='Camptotheca acuminata' phytoplasma TaxID=3239192 RepID=UPI00351A81B7
MLKTIYEAGYLNIEKILINEYNKMDLTSQELIILLCLFNCYENKNFSSVFLAEKTNLSKNEVENILAELLKKNFFSLSQEKQDDKIIEVFNLDNTFLKIEEIYSEKTKKIKLKEKKTNIAETIEEIEKLKKNNLASFELEIIKNWYLNQNFSHEDIIKAIEQAVVHQQKSIYYIDRLLNYKNNNIKFEKDNKTDQILHKIFSKIK